MLGRFSIIFPISIGYWLSDRCGDLTWALSPRYRANVRSNLSHAMDLPPDHREVRRRTRKVFHYSARNFFDLLRVALLTDDELRAAVYGSKESWDRLEAARAAGKGAIIVSSHYGAFDYTGQSIFIYGYPIISLTTRTVPEFIYRIVTLLRKSHGLTIKRRRHQASARCCPRCVAENSPDCFPIGISFKTVSKSSSLENGRRCPWARRASREPPVPLSLPPSPSVYPKGTF